MLAGTCALGHGGWARSRNSAAPARAIEDAAAPKLVAICGNDPLKTRSLADRFDIPDVYDIGGLLEAKGCRRSSLRQPSP
jgi:predicted dehydrogenase